MNKVRGLPRSGCECRRLFCKMRESEVGSISVNGKLSDEETKLVEVTGPPLVLLPAT